MREQSLIPDHPAPPAAIGETSSPIETLPVPILVQRCQEETQKYLRRQVSDDRYCLELFHRALIGRDDAAWVAVYQQYAPLVLSWVARYSHAIARLGHESAEELVNATFAKFSQAIPPAKVSHFDQLARLLKYLRLCVHSVVSDAVRALAATRRDESLERIEQELSSIDLADAISDRLLAQEIWEILRRTLSEDEYLILLQAFVHGLKPEEISRQYRQRFPTKEDVYRIRRNALERLRRNQELRHLQSQLSL